MRIPLVLAVPKMAAPGRKYPTMRKEKCSPRSSNSNTLSKRVEQKQRDYGS